MDFFDEKRFSFLYGGKKFWELPVKKDVAVSGNTVTATYLLSDGMKITNVLKKYEKYDAYEWVNYFENTGLAASQIISELWDCDCKLSCCHTEAKKSSPYQTDPEELMQIFSVKGSDISEDEFAMSQTDLTYYYRNCLFYDPSWDMGSVKKYHNAGGRSSQETAPFFNIHQNGEGVIMAIGWTGQWNCQFVRDPDTVRLQSKIEDTHFRLFPGEKIRTSSVMLMFYKGSVADSQNKWRHLLREEITPVKSADELPYSAGVWGGMTSDAVKERIDILQKAEIPVTHIWMDAGWYGKKNKPTPNEFEGDWWTFTGDWTITPEIHPEGMQDIKKKVADAGKKFLLWFEPERVHHTVPIVKAHPEYFIKIDGDINLLLNLGKEEVYRYCFDMLEKKIKELNISCYRQDFNFDPLIFWRSADTEERKGITEIKYINALYRLWDELLERFPGLLIDNCASGGRRIDIETLKRSVPLWRSDAQCPANYPPELSQVHQADFSLWVPYSGSSCGRVYDTYRMRSAYTPAFTTNFTFSQTETFGDDPQKLEWFKKQSEEYLSIRHFFDGDIYRLTEPSVSKDAWNAVQWALDDSGMIQIFKHEDSPYCESHFILHGIEEDKQYEITDLDGKTVTASGKELKETGLRVRIDEKKAAKIFCYRILN